MNTFLRSNLFNGLYLRRTALAISLLLMVGESWGQAFSGTYTFANVTIASGTTDPTPVPTATGIIFSSFNSSVGTNPNAAGRFSFTGWPTGATNGSDVFSGALNTASYYEVTVTVASGYTVSLSSIVFTLQRSGTGIRQYTVRSDADGYTTNLTASISPTNIDLSVVPTNIFQVVDATTAAEDGSTITLSGVNFTNLTAGSTRTFRFYGWNAEASGGSFSIDNVVISGSASIACLAPTLTSASSSNINTLTADLSANITNTGGGATITERGFQYSTSSTLAAPVTNNETGTFSTGTFTRTVSGLTQNTLYYYRGYAINNCTTPQTGYTHTSGFPTFTTISNPPSSPSAGTVSATSFLASWSAPAAQGAAALTYTVSVFADAALTIPVTSVSGITGTSTTISGLTPSTAYYYRVVAVNAGGTSTSADFTTGVTTLPPPTVSLTTTAPALPAGNILVNSENNPVYLLAVSVNPGTSDAVLTGLQVVTAGTYAASDLTNLKLWYSADNSFSDTDQPLATVTNPGAAGTKTFSGFSATAITPGSTGYFFITADVPCNAVIDNNLNFNNTDQTQTTFSVTPNFGTVSTFGGGLQTFKAPVPINATGVTPTAGNNQVAIAWTAPTGCYDEVIIVAHTASITGTPSGTYTAVSTSYTNGSNPAFPGGGVVVYNGTASPQTITSLTNNQLYFFKIFARKGPNWSTGVQVSATPITSNQATDFFRSNSNTTGTGGNWATASNWEYSPDNGITPWQIATLVPSNSATGILIRNGHNINFSIGTLTADHLTVEAGATFTVSGGDLTIDNGSGTDLIVSGTYTVSGGSVTYIAGYTVTFAAGAAYNHNINGGTIPASTWNATSTCTISGMTGTAPANIPQAYGNFIWNNTSQSAFVNINNASFSVAGTFTMNSSGSSNLTLVGATTTSYTYNIANIIVNNGAFNLCVLNADNGGKATVNVSGNITVASSTSAFLNFVFGSSGNPGSFSYRGEIILSGNVTVGSNGYFYASHANGNAYGRLTLNGTGNQINIATGTSARREKIDYLVNTGASALLTANLTLFTSSRLEVDGTFDNNGEFQLLDGGTGSPSIIIDGKFITRDAQGFSGTSAAIPGIAPVLTAGCTIEYGRAGNQAVQSRTDYSNITFSNSGTKTLASGCNPAGTVYITGTAIFEQSNNTFGDNGTSLTMDGGRYRLSGTGTKPDINGAYSLTGGIIEFYNSAGTRQNIKGINNSPDPINYLAIEVTGANVGQSTSNITLQNGGSFTIKNGGVFTNNDDAIVGPSGTQTLTIETGGKFVTGNALGFYGGVLVPNSPSVRNNIENIVFQTNSTVEYSRTTAQSFTPAPVNYKNVIISGGGMKTLTGAVTMEEVLTLTSGLVTTSNTNLLTLTSTATCPAGGSSSSFINGPMKKIGNTAFNFPVGKLVNNTTPHYRYIGLGAGGLDTEEFNAEFLRESSRNRGWISAAAATAGLQRVSYCEHWLLYRVNGSATRSVTLTWTEQSNCNVNYVTDINELVVVQYTGTEWGDTFGRSSFTGVENPIGTATSTITWDNSNSANAPSNYYFFTLGSTDLNANPLPFQLNTFNAKPKQTAIQLDWSVGNNHQQQQYILERGSNAQVFETIATVNAKQGFTAADYLYDDAKPLNGWNYYRLRAIGTDGKSNSSSIIKVWWGKGVAINVLPNPASEKIVINLSEPSSIKEIQIVNAMGQVMRKLTTVQFFNEVNISSMQAGIYYIRFLGENGLTTRSFVKQ